MQPPSTRNVFETAYQTLIIIAIGAAVIAAVLGLSLWQKAEKPEPDPLAPRLMSKPVTVKENGYIVHVGPVVAREPTPANAQVAVQVVSKGERPGNLACALLTPEGVPLGGGGIQRIDLMFGATMHVQGPLLSEGRMKCYVVETTDEPRIPAG